MIFVVGLLSFFPAWVVWCWKGFFYGVITWFFCMFQAFMLFGLETSIPLSMVLMPELFVGFVIFQTWWIFGRKSTSSYQPGPKIPYVKAPINLNAPIYFPAPKGYQPQMYCGPRFVNQAQADAWLAAHPPTRING